MFGIRIVQPMADGITMNLILKLVLLLLFLLSRLALAQDPWTLDACVAYALEHNLQLKDFEYSTESNRESYRQSFRDLLPNINATTNYNIRFGRSVDPNDNSIITTDFFSNNYSIDATLDLFKGFQKINLIKASSLLYKATKEETLQQKYLLAFRVMQAFYDIRFYEGLVANSADQLAVSQANFDLVKKQIALGLKAGADLYEAESLLLTDKLNLTQSKNQLEAARLRLMQEMNLNERETITIQHGMIREPDMAMDVASQPDSIFGQARGFLPIIKARELQVQAAKKSVSAARGDLYPSLSIFGGYGTGYYETTQDTLGNTIPFSDQFRDNTFQFVGLNLSIPISNGWSGRSRVKQQKIEQLRAQNNLDLQEQVLYQTIQSLVQDYEALRLEYEQSAQTVKAQELAFTIAQKRYEKGLINALELITAKNLFANAQNQNLQVRLRWEINKSTLDFYRGLPVFSINPIATP